MCVVKLGADTQKAGGAGVVAGSTLLLADLMTLDQIHEPFDAVQAHLQAGSAVLRPAFNAPT